MLKYLVIIEKTDNGFSAYVPDLPGCIAAGETHEETEELIYEAVEAHLEMMTESGEPAPKPMTEAETMTFSLIETA